MTDWKEIILYTFVSYLLFHIVIDDIVLIIKYFNRNNQNQENDISESEQRSIVKIIYKISDVIKDCVVKYLEVFATCWIKCLDCLQITMCEYIKFLDSLSKTLLIYPTCIYTCSSAVLVIAIACMTVILIIE